MKKTPFREVVLQLNHEHERLVAPIVADGAIATAGVGDGRIIPVVILDTSARSDIDAAIEAQAYTPQGDVKVQWGRLPGRDGTLTLNLTFVRPAETFVIVEFDLAKNHGILVEQVLESRGLYIQAGRPGDRLKNDLSRPKVLAEIPDTGFRPLWEKIYLDHTAKMFRERGMSRPAAKRAARFAVGEIQSIAAARPRFASDGD